MKKIILSVLFLYTIVAVNAQVWHLDFNEAKKLATEKNRNIILAFEGSDWCAPCIKLECEIWDSEEFKSYAKTHFVLLKADFPKRKMNKLSGQQQLKNNKLAEKYNPKGFFPFVVVLDKTGKTLGTTGYRKVSTVEYINLLSSF
ncbi:MAG: thioredoxin family protein [Draconibacterium sp.]|nr:thioredoxin family protein [Draconibacterium sp.]